MVTIGEEANKKTKAEVDNSVIGLESKVALLEGHLSPLAGEVSLQRNTGQGSDLMEEVNAKLTECHSRTCCSVDQISVNR